MIIVKKEYETPQGVIAEIWRPGMMTVDNTNEEFSFSLNLYMNESKAKESDKFIYTLSYSKFSFNNITKEDMDILYNKYFSENSQYKNIIIATAHFAVDNIETFNNGEILDI